METETKRKFYGAMLSRYGGISATERSMHWTPKKLSKILSGKQLAKITDVLSLSRGLGMSPEDIIKVIGGINLGENTYSVPQHGNPDSKHPPVDNRSYNSNRRVSPRKTRPYTLRTNGTG